MKEQILSYINTITPKQFFIIYLGTWSILLLLGYFLSGGLYVFLTCLLLIASVIVVYKYQSPPIYKNQSVFLIPLFGIFYYGLINSGLLFAPQLIQDKSQSQMISGIIPAEHEYIRGSGKGAKNRYYLNINGERFHCDDDDYDDCEKVYAYHGQKATVYHYDGLAYEIEIDGQKVYEFNAQAQKFKDTQNKKQQQLIWAIILFGIPSVLFYFINKIVIRDLPVINESQAQQISQENLAVQKQQKQQFQQRVGYGGQAWRILFALLGTICVIVFVVFWVAGKYWGMTLFFVMMIGYYYLASLPYKNAKKEIALYQELLDSGEDLDELSAYASSGFYNHMGIIAWIIMYVINMLAFFFVFSLIIWIFRDTGVQSKFGDFAISIILLFLFLLCLAIIYALIKRAIINRDLAIE